MNRNAAQVFTTFLKLGLTSFGGPIAHLGYFRKEIVERQKWVTESQYGQLLAICQFLPGPASSQLGFILGLLRGGLPGAVAAFLAFTLPSALLLVLFASLLPLLSGSFGQSLIHGLKLVACAVVADAVLGMWKKLCPDLTRRIIAVVAALILVLASSAWMQIFVVALGAVAGMFLLQQVNTKNGAAITVTYGKRTALGLLLLFGLLLVGLASVASWPGLAAVANAFYRAGALVFGGGHVVLPLLEESVVQTGWITEESFLAGYGAAQAIPGPMFSFSAYLGAVIPSGYGSLVTASVALLFMFLPGFLLVVAALPVWQSVSGIPRAARAIAGVNAAVVGLLAAALYDPILTTSIEGVFDLAIAAVGFCILAVWKRSPLYVVGWCVAASVIAAWAPIN